MADITIATEDVKQQERSVDDLDQSNPVASTRGRGPVCNASVQAQPHSPPAMGPRVKTIKPTTKRTKALKTPAAKVPENKKCDDDALKKDWKHSYCTMLVLHNVPPEADPTFIFPMFGGHLEELD